MAALGSKVGLSLTYRVTPSGGDERLCPRVAAVQPLPASHKKWNRGAGLKVNSRPKGNLGGPVREQVAALAGIRLSSPDVRGGAARAQYEARELVDESLGSGAKLASADRATNGAAFATSVVSRLEVNMENVEGILDGVESRAFDEKLDKNASPSLVLATGVKCIPHPDKVEKGGEDAYFVVHDLARGVIGVADGVGGWAEDGVDPALYSREFVAHASAAAHEDQGRLDPRWVLHKAATTTSSLGAATVVIAMLGEDDVLRIANLGDSGLRIIRNGKMIFATPVLQHYFDCPFQFGPESTDTAADAEVFEVKLREGDTLVMGSDGLFDNMFDADIEAVVSLFGGRDEEAAERTACAMAALARKHAADDEYDSPYVLEAIDEGLDVPFWQKMLGKKLTGGKMDDITVVVSHVVALPDLLESFEHEQEAAMLMGSDDARDEETVRGSS